MYSIDSIKTSDDNIQIIIKYNNITIGKKNLELSFNENKTPTFSDSGCVYSSIDFQEFINNIQYESETNIHFSFDDLDNFDGFEIDNDNFDNKKYFYIKTINEKTNNNIMILMDSVETVEGIKKDLQFLLTQIDEMITSLRQHYDILENPFEEI